MVSFQRRKRVTFALAFALIFVFFAVCFPLNPSHPSSPNANAYKSLFHSLLPRLGSSTTQSTTCSYPSPTNESKKVLPRNQTETDHDFSISNGGADGNQTQLKSVPLRSDGDTSQQNQTRLSNDTLKLNGDPERYQTQTNHNASNSNGIPTEMEPEFSGSNATIAQNQTRIDMNVSNLERAPAQDQTQLKEDVFRSDGVQAQTKAKQILESSKGKEEEAVEASIKKKKKKKGAKRLKWEKMVDSLKRCDLFDGKWVRDESYPLYQGGSCPLIDEPFDCFVNGRPEQGYEKWRWKPNGCVMPGLNAKDMLERLRGKRLVFVGDSLNRNMWESLVCILRNSIQNKTKVFEASGQNEFRTGEGSYSFVFEDYQCSIEFFRSNFLVQEWEVSAPNGTKKETLRLDLIEQWSSEYKDADVIVFNTAHWWTHEKTWEGKDYYQEGGHVHPALDVVEAFRRALTTWGRWVDNNVNSNRTLVFFRGYSSSHFSGGQWNSGGACDGEIEPITDDAYLEAYPPMMRVLEDVITDLRTPVIYLNITVMTDYRKDAHPSMYQKPNLTEEERRSPERYQDCSHWCLPGVPDLWNELLYAQLLIKQGPNPKRIMKT